MSINYQENIIYQIYPLGACDAFNNEGISIIFNGVCIKEKHDFWWGFNTSAAFNILLEDRKVAGLSPFFYAKSRFLCMGFKGVFSPYLFKKLGGSTWDSRSHDYAIVELQSRE